jgi:hypothetical protein
MAKTPKTLTTNGNPAAPVAHGDIADLFANGSVKYGQWELALRDIAGNPKAVMYLLQNGFTQSLVDSAAFSKEDKAGKTDDEVAAMAVERRNARFAAIRAGDVGTRVGGPKLPAIERVMRDVAEERLRAIATAKGVKMPTGDVLRAALAKITERDPDGIRNEAETRIANAKAVAAQVGDDDLFAPATA